MSLGWVLNGISPRDKSICYVLLVALVFIGIRACRPPKVRSYSSLDDSS